MPETYFFGDLNNYKMADNLDVYFFEGVLSKGSTSFCCQDFVLLFCCHTPCIVHSPLDSGKLVVWLVM